MTTETQCKQIAAHLKGDNTITALEALSLFGCFRLATHPRPSRGWLRHHRGENQDDHGKTVAQYRMG